MSNRATTIRNVAYSDSDSLTFDQPAQHAPLSAGQATLYPTNVETSVVLRSKLGVVIMINDVTSGTVTADIIRNDSGRTVTDGEICEMSQLITTTVHVLDNDAYDRSRKGLTQAYAAVLAAGGGEIYVPPGDDIDWDNAVVTMNLTTDEITWAAHGLDADVSVVSFSNSGGALPTGITAGTKYWVRDLTTNTFKISATRGGAAIDLSGAQSGVHTAVAGIEYTGDHSWLNWHPTVTLNAPSGATNFHAIRYFGPGGGVWSAALTANAAQGAVGLVVGAVASAALNTAVGGDAGALGTIIFLTQTLTDLNDAGSDQLVGRCWSNDTVGGAVYITTPTPKPFLMASTATVRVLRTGKGNRVTGFKFNGLPSAAATEVIGIFLLYQEDFLAYDLYGSDIAGPLICQGDYCYNTQWRDSYAVRCGNAAGLHAFENVHNSNGSFRNLISDDCVFGTELKGQVSCNWYDMRSNGAMHRGFKAHHAYNCNAFGHQSGGQNLNAGTTYSGDSIGTRVFGISSHGSLAEDGLLLTQVPAGTNVVQRCHFHGVTSHGAARAGIYCDVGSAYNTFSDYNVDSITDGGTGNHFKESLGLTDITTAGDAVYTAAQMATGLITRDPNGANRSDTTPTAALLITGLKLSTDGQVRECYLINTANAAETITLVAGANVTIVNVGQTIAQDESVKLVIRRTSSTTVSIYIVGA